jgi:hypothetical protein
MNEFDAVTAAFASLATLQTQLVPTFISGGRLPKRFQPGQTFQFNRQGFVRYLATALNARAPFDAIRPAWEDFVAVFPHHIATSTLQFTDLMLAAYTVHVHFQGLPAAQVADTLHNYVAALPEILLPMRAVEDADAQ